MPTLGHIGEVLGKFFDPSDVRLAHGTTRGAMECVEDTSEHKVHKISARLF
jgi:hypothetical protein